VGGLRPRSFALGPWSPVWGVGLGGSWSFALRVGVGVPKRGWWRLKRVRGRGVRGWAWRGVGLRLVRPKRARGRVGRGHRPGCVRATEGPGAGSVRMRDVWACGARVGAVGRAATHLGRGVLRQHHTQAYPLR